MGSLEPKTPLTRLIFYLSFSIAKDDSLCDCESVVEITKCVKLPLFFLNCNEKLFDSFQSQLITKQKSHISSIVAALQQATLSIGLERRLGKQSSRGRVFKHLDEQVRVFLKHAIHVNVLSL